MHGFIVVKVGQLFHAVLYRDKDKNMDQDSQQKQQKQETWGR